MYSSVSVVVPVYNSEKSIPELYSRLHGTLGRICDKYEIVMVDDGSMDNSLMVMHSLNADENILRIIGLDGNFGQQNAIMCGLRHSAGDYIITIDDDLQHPPEEIPKLLQELDKGFDVVYGIPSNTKQRGIRNLGSCATDLFFTLVCFKPKDIKVGSFRALRRHIVEKIIKEDNAFVYITAITLKHTRRIANVEVEHAGRRYGRSNYSFCKLIGLFFKLFVNYSGIPIKPRGSKAPQYIIK